MIDERHADQMLGNTGIGFPNMGRYIGVMAGGRNRKVQIQHTQQQTSRKSTDPSLPTCSIVSQGEALVGILLPFNLALQMIENNYLSQGANEGQR